MPSNQKERLRLVVRGAVQGVGFRPFVYRLAHELELAGWVNNASEGVFVEVEGTPTALEAFRRRLEAERPPRSLIQSVEADWLEPAGFQGFSIRHSDGAGAKSALVLPDIATCPDCLREVLDPHDRRHRYPFTNCTHCGPRFSIVERLPYDRPHTTMKAFPLCPRCRAEYEDPLDRRFHAQPTACPDCGPQLALWDASGTVLAARDDALRAAAGRIGAGEIVALKGLGGFQLLCDARAEHSVAELRRRKGRDAKPFALMVADLSAAEALCELSEAERALLTSPEAPVVLLRARAGSEIARSVAPDNPYLGLMLPYTPLHHLLLLELGFPIVATSGNRSDEPICTHEREALARLGGIADAFLVHDRPIARGVDDSVARVMDGKPRVLRRARGYAPLPITLPEAGPPALAVGGFLKNTVAVSVGKDVFLSQHVGDLETGPARAAFRQAISDLCALYELNPEAVAADAHPDYPSTRHAEGLKKPVIRVQHHHAHVLSCLAEHGLSGPALGVAWDGTGLGDDGTVWGGEFFRVGEDVIERIAHLRTFPLPGGDRAAIEPRRAALGLLFEMYGEAALERIELPTLAAFSRKELDVMRAALARGLNAPRSSSAGRLFDALASLLGLAQRSGHEGQAAQRLEFAAERAGEAHAYPFAISGHDDGPWMLDWGPLVERALAEREAGAPVEVIARCVHLTMVEMIAAAAQRAGLSVVALSGGCFQNRLLTERTLERLRGSGFEAYAHETVPPNDGGLALGQLLGAWRKLRAQT